MDLLADFEARGLVQDSTDRDALRDRLNAGPVGVYYGCDPSADSLHIGNLIGLLVLRRFADAGHNAVALAGGATGMIGDPGGRSKERNLLDAETLTHNTKRIAEQLERISRVSLVNNLGWTGSLTLLDFLRDVGKHASVNQMIARESVKARLESDIGISFTEFSYQLLQANDYLHLFRNHGVEIQIGGSDQWGNIVGGVELGRRSDGRTLFGMTTPLITTASGAKMGKSVGGAVWLNEEKMSPYEYWQFWRNTEDADVGRFLRLFTELPIDEIIRLERLQGSELNEAKKVLATETTILCHGREAAEAAAETAQALFVGSIFQSPDVSAPSSGSRTRRRASALIGLREDWLGSMPHAEVPRDLLSGGIAAFELFTRAGLASSNSEARRLIRGGGARINDIVVETETKAISTADLDPQGMLKLSAGRKRHAFIRPV